MPLSGGFNQSPDKNGKCVTTDEGVAPLPRFLTQEAFGTGAGRGALSGLARGTNGTGFYVGSVSLWYPTRKKLAAGTRQHSAADSRSEAAGEEKVGHCFVKFQVNA